MKLFKKNNINDEIRKLLGLSYFMQPEERLTYRLLLHYAFVLHEDVTNLTDFEIQKARDMATNYLQNHPIIPSDIDSELQSFVNKEVLYATTNINFDRIKDEITKKIYDDLTISNCIGNLKKSSLHFYLNSDDDNIIINVSNNNKNIFYIYKIYKNTLVRNNNSIITHKDNLLEKTTFNKKTLKNINSNNINVEFSPIEIGINEYGIDI